MKEIPISRFGVTCGAVIEQVRRTGIPVRITRFGKPIAEILPPTPAPGDRIELGTLRNTVRFMGDIVSPVSDPSKREVPPAD